MARRKEMTHLSELGQMPTLWVEGRTVAERKPILETYGGVMDMLDQAISAARLGFCFRLDTYRGEIGPVGGGTLQDEAHLTVWKEIRSDAVITGGMDDV